MCNSLAILGKIIIKVFEVIFEKKDGQNLFCLSNIDKMLFVCLRDANWFVKYMEGHQKERKPLIEQHYKYYTKK